MCKNANKYAKEKKLSTVKGGVREIGTKRGNSNLGIFLKHIFDIQKFYTENCKF